MDGEAYGREIGGSGNGDRSVFSLGSAWNWQYDSHFIYGLEERCRQAGLSTYLVNPGNIGETLDLAIRGEIAFAAFFDRASDDDPAFLPLMQYIHRSGTVIFNDPHLVDEARDKSIMHKRLMYAGIQVPYSVIIPAYNESPDIIINSTDLARLGDTFMVKPATMTGGGRGVIGAKTVDDIMSARMHYPDDTYLLQRIVTPSRIGDRTAWFRSFYAFGKVIPTWWDPITHIYEPITKRQKEDYDLVGIDKMMRRIQKLCLLDFFSSELVRTSDGRFYVIDYVNEVPDMRLQSEHMDGVPDGIVSHIQDILAREAQLRASSNGNL